MNEVEKIKAYINECQHKAKELIKIANSHNDIESARMYVDRLDTYGGLLNYIDTL